MSLTSVNKKLSYPKDSAGRLSLRYQGHSRTKVTYFITSRSPYATSCRLLMINANLHHVFHRF